MRDNSFKVLVGSHNYNLNHEASDKDYKIFFYPSFDEIYFGQIRSKSKTSNVEDIERHDIRKLPEMLWKSNVNFIEVLFSVEEEMYDSLLQELKEKREDIAKMNLPYLFDACMGMFTRSKKDFERDIDKDFPKACKHVMKCVRITDFLFRYYMNGWNFQKAFSYSKDDFMYKLLMDIRNGKYPTEQALRNISERFEAMAASIKDEYKSQSPDEEIMNWVRETVKNHVKNHLEAELSN